MDLGDGSAMYFSHSRDSSSGFETASYLKVLHRLAAAPKPAQSSSAAIDSAGVVHGDMPVCRDLIPGSARRAKLFHGKKQARVQAAKDAEGGVLCTSPRGRV